MSDSAAARASNEAAGRPTERAAEQTGDAAERCAHVLRAFVQELAAHDQLTRREADVVLETLRGRGTKEVAHVIGCSESTVYKYWTRILSKTGLPNRESFVAHAITAALMRQSTANALPT